MNNFESQLSLTQSLIHPVLEEILSDLSACHPRLVAAASHGLLKGGKRFRAHLTRVTADLLGINRAHSLKVAAAIEMVHAYSLMHDDLPCMDNAAMRRGYPSAHIAFDQPTALLAGNALLTEGINLLTDENCHPDPLVRLQLVKELLIAVGFKGMMAGQMMDILANSQSLQELENMEALKTGHLLAFAVKAPLIMAKEKNLDKHPLVVLATTFGLMFQMVDDILDISQEEKILGKPVGLDQHNNKITFIDVLGLEATKKRAAHLMEQALAVLPSSLNPEGLWNDIGHFILSRPF